jgi:hypothetical protein
METTNVKARIIKTAPSNSLNRLPANFKKLSGNSRGKNLKPEAVLLVP